MTKLIGLILISLTIATSAFADVRGHYIVLFNEATDTKLTVMIPDAANPVASLTVSTLVGNPLKDVVVQKYLTAEYVFLPDKSLLTFVGFRAFIPNNVIVEITPAYHNNSKCLVQSNLKEFYLSKAQEIDCNYFFSTGPKPAFTGSN